MARTRAGSAKGVLQPPRPHGLLVNIRSLMPNLPPAERRVAAAAVDDPAGVSQMTISTLATHCTTSETTVIRFCRSIGLKGYPELRVALAAAGGRADSARRPALGRDIGPKDDTERIVAKICYADAKAIEETAEQLDLDVLEAVASAIVRCRRIDVYGVGASGLVALDLQQKLYRIGYAAFAWADPNMAVTSGALLGRRDVAIGISHTGASIDTVAALDQATRSGAMTVALTNFPRSPIAGIAAHVLTTAARETTFRSGAMASRVAQLSVVDCLFAVVARRHYTATVRALNRTHDAVASRHLGL